MKKMKILVLCLVSVFILTACSWFRGGEVPETPEATAEEKLAEYLNSLDIGGAMGDVADDAVPDYKEMLADRKMQIELSGVANGESAESRIIAADGVLYLVDRADDGIFALKSVNWFGDEMLYTIDLSGAENVSEGIYKVVSTDVKSELNKNGYVDTAKDYSEAFKKMKLENIKPTDITLKDGWYEINEDFVNNSLQKATIEMLGGDDLDTDTERKIKDLIALIKISFAVKFDGKELCGVKISLLLDEAAAESAEGMLGGDMGFESGSLFVEMTYDSNTRKAVLTEKISVSATASNVSAEMNMSFSFDENDELVSGDIDAKILIESSANDYVTEIVADVVFDFSKVYTKGASVLVTEILAEQISGGERTEILDVSASLKNDENGYGEACLCVVSGGQTVIDLSGKAYYDVVPNPPKLDEKIDNVLKNIDLISDTAEAVGRGLAENYYSAVNPDAYIYLDEAGVMLHVYTTYTDSGFMNTYYIYEGKDVPYGDSMRGYTVYYYEAGELQSRRIAGRASDIAEKIYSLLDDEDIAILSEGGLYRDKTFYYPLGTQNSRGENEYVAIKFDKSYGKILLKDSYFVDGMQEDRTTSYYVIDFDSEEMLGAHIFFSDCYYNLVGREIASFVTDEHFPPNQTNYVNLYYALDEYDDMGDALYLEITVIRIPETGEIFKAQGYNIRNLEFISDEVMTVVEFTDESHSGISVVNMEKPKTAAEKIRDEIVALIDEDDMTKIGQYGSYWYYDTGAVDENGSHRFVRLSMYLRDGQAVCTDVYGGYIPVVYSSWLFVSFDDEGRSGISVEAGAFAGKME